MKGIVEILGEVVAGLKEDLTISVCDGVGHCTEIEEPEVNYIFGNDMYIKEQLDTMSKSPQSADRKPKFPLVALFTPVIEKRDSADYQMKANVNILIACSSRQEWSNEQRLTTSFVNILRPVYERLMSALKSDRRLNVAYDGVIPHTYSENYSYGRYGAYTQSGEQVSEPIDAINVGNLEIKIKNVKCVNRRLQ